jgi:hypothetical protein
MAQTPWVSGIRPDAHAREMIMTSAGCGLQCYSRSGAPDPNVTSVLQLPQASCAPEEVV